MRQVNDGQKDRKMASKLRKNEISELKPLGGYKKRRN